MAQGWKARIGTWARAVKRDLGALWLAARDPRVPLAAKLIAGMVVAYAASPIDLIPDFIPVLGLLDDAIIVPLGILAAVRLIPAPLLAELRARAEAAPARPRSLVAAGFVVIAWLGIAAILGWLALGPRLP